MIIFKRLIAYFLIGIVLSWGGASFIRYNVESYNKTHLNPTYTTVEKGPSGEMEEVTMEKTSSGKYRKVTAPNFKTYYHYDIDAAFQSGFILGILITINLVLLNFYKKSLLKIPFLLFSISTAFGYCLGFQYANEDMNMVSSYTYLNFSEEWRNKGMFFGIGIGILLFAFNLLKKSDNSG